MLTTYNAESLVPLVDEVERLEAEIKQLKEVEKKAKEAKQKLYEAMYNSGLKSLDMGGVKLTLIEEVDPCWQDKVVFDERRFKEENPELYFLYADHKSVKVNGRKGYVKVTIR